MGAFSSKTSDSHKKASHVRCNDYGYDGLGDQPFEFESTEKQCRLSTLKAIESTVERADLRSQEKKSVSNHQNMTGRVGNHDDFYDGIPRYSRDLSQGFRSMRTKQGSQVSSRLSRAGTLGIEKAVEVLDILGSSMTNLNPKSGFISGVTIKGNELSILAFEVANTIVKGYGLMQSISNRSIEQLKENMLSSEGVQKLVSRDINELLKMVAMDKREELKTFSAEVIRFGNRCKNPQWHNLDRYFERQIEEPHKQFKGETEIVMLQFMTLVHHTAELYQELNTLDRLENNNQHKNRKENNSNDTHSGEDLATVSIKLKRQKKKVKAIKKKSLWSKSMEEVMEKLVEIVLFLNREINNAFGSTNANTESSGSLIIGKRLGAIGLSLHYANIVQQIDSIVSRTSSVPSNAREILYHNLPPHIKSSLRSKLQTFHVNEEFTVTEINVEMEKTLSWLSPIAANTSKAHQGFGWVGEWASTRSDTNQKQVGMLEITRIETLHYADKGKTEDCILELLLWLNLMIKQINAIAQSSMALPRNQVSTKYKMPTHNMLMLRDISNRKRSLGMSKSQRFECRKVKLIKHDRLSKSC